MPSYLFVIFWLHWYSDWTGLLHLSRIPLSTRLLESSSNFLNSSTDNPLSFYLKTNEDTDFIRNTLALA